METHKFQHLSSYEIQFETTKNSTNFNRLLVQKNFTIASQSKKLFVIKTNTEARRVIQCLFCSPIIIPAV